MNETIFSGAVLRERREALGYTLHEVQHRIHVPVKCLGAFESGAFERLPGRAYAVGFLRSYCRFLEVDPDYFVDQYLVCTRPRAAAGRLTFMKLTEDTSVRSYPRWLNEVIIWGCVCSVVLLGWLSYSTVVHPIVESWRSRVEAGAEATTPPVHFFEDF